MGRELNEAEGRGRGWEKCEAAHGYVWWGERNVISTRVSSIIYCESKNGSGTRRGSGWASGNKGGPLSHCQNKKRGKR